MINVTPIATTTAEDVTLTSNYIWYKMFEASGTTLSDQSGSGADLTLHGTLPGAVFNNLGWITPNGTDTEAYGTDDAHIKSVMRLDTMTSGQLIICFDYLFDGATTGNEAFFWWGRNNSSVWGAYLNSSGQFDIIIAGDTGANDNVPAFAGFNLGTAHGSIRNAITFDMQGQGDGTATVDVYVNGADSPVVSNTGTITLAGLGVGGTTDTNGDGLTLMARRTGASSVDMLMSSAAGNARMSSFFATQLSSINTTLAAKVNQEFYDKKGDMPTILDGK